MSAPRSGRYDPERPECWCALIDPPLITACPTHGSPVSPSTQRGVDADAPITYGLCLHCQSIEVALNKATGVRDLSCIGESDTYPTGYGCELCA